MAERAGRDTWTIQGETITLPLHLRDARMTAAVFTCSPAAAASVLAGTPLRPLVVAGRAFSVLMCIHYGDWPLKAYDEVGVCVFVRGRGGGRRQPEGQGGGLRQDEGRSRLPGLHIVDLPVTGDFTREAGQDFWALPKWLMDADLTFRPDHTSVAVRSGGAEVMRAAFTHPRRFPSLPAAMPAWSYLDRGAQADRLLHGWLPMHLSGVRLGRAPASVRLPNADLHPMAARMRALGMLGRSLFTVHAERLSGRLGSFTPAA